MENFLTSIKAGMEHEYCCCFACIWKPPIDDFESMDTERKSGRLNVVPSDNLAFNTLCRMHLKISAIKDATSILVNSYKYKETAEFVQSMSIIFNF